MIAAQDDWNRIETIVDQALHRAHAGLHPALTTLAQRTRNQKVEKLNSHSAQRSAFVNDTAAMSRDARFKEELGIYNFMKNNGCENMDQKQIVDQFNREAAGHPILVPRKPKEARIVDKSAPVLPQDTQSQHSIMSLQSPSQSVLNMSEVQAHSACTAVRSSKHRMDSLTEGSIVSPVAHK